MKPTLFFLLWFCISVVFAADSRGPEKGLLYLSGGGAVDVKYFIDTVIEQTANEKPQIVIISTALGPKRKAIAKLDEALPIQKRIQKINKNVSVKELYLTRKRKANRPETVEAINEAQAIWITGGNQSYLTDVFLDTRALIAMRNLLTRGGVIGGSSAGTQVQSTFMTRGDFGPREIFGDKRHQLGFNFFKNSVFDVHVAERGREKDLLKLHLAPKKYFSKNAPDPADLLGVGIDAGTAVIVRHTYFEVHGSGNVYVYDPDKWVDGRYSYQILKDGDHFDLTERKKMNDIRESTKAATGGH